jgi:hypothetical protein
MTARLPLASIRKTPSSARPKIGPSWLWKKLSMAFFHESEPQKSQGFSRFATAASSSG